MGEAAEAFVSPYAHSPGSSTPPPSVAPREGLGELWTFFWLALVNTAIIAVTGIIVWWIVH